MEIEKGRRLVDRQLHREMDRETDGQGNRHIKIERWTNKQTDRDRKTDR